MHTVVRSPRRSRFTAQVIAGDTHEPTFSWASQEAAMSRYAAEWTDALAWIEVSTGQPCPICGGTSRCVVYEDGEFVRCLEVVCDWPVLTGGWLHRIENRPAELIATP
jgi:hypothetical protein